MDEKIVEILDHIRTVSGDSLIALAINHFLCSYELTPDNITKAARQLKDQIQDNPIMMQEVLTPKSYAFFCNCVL